jgi:hypothetical protein
MIVLTESVLIPSKNDPQERDAHVQLSPLNPCVYDMGPKNGHESSQSPTTKKNPTGSLRSGPWSEKGGSNACLTLKNSKFAGRSKW